MARDPHRSAQRVAPATFRMSVAEKARLKQDAAEAGLTLQQLFELRMFGEAKPRGRDGRPPKTEQAEQLPMAG